MTIIIDEDNIKYAEKALTGTDSPYTTAGEQVYTINTSANGAVTVTLSSADTESTHVKRFIDVGGAIETNAVTFNTEASELVDGVSSLTWDHNNGSYVDAWSDGENWFTSFQGAVDSLTIGGESIGSRVIESQSGTGENEIDFTTGIDTDHRRYEFHLTNVINSADAGKLYMRTSTDGGSTFDTGASDYSYATHAVDSAGNVTGSGSTADSELEIAGVPETNVGSAAGESGVSGMVSLSNPSNASVNTVLGWDLTYIDADGNVVSEKGGGARQAAEAVNAVRFIFNAGTIDSCTIELLGVN